MASAKELERCPKCGRFQVYSRHDMKTDKWDIHCDCGFGTKEFATWRLARRSWNKMVEQLKECGVNAYEPKSDVKEICP